MVYNVKLQQLQLLGFVSLPGHLNTSYKSYSCLRAAKFKAIVELIHLKLLLNQNRIQNTEHEMGQLAQIKA